MTDYSISAHNYNPDHEHDKAHEIDMRVLSQAIKLSDALLDVKASRLGHSENDNTVGLAVSRLLDAGLIAEHSADPRGWPTYRVTIAGFKAAGVKPPLWVVGEKS